MILSNSDKHPCFFHPENQKWKLSTNAMPPTEDHKTFNLKKKKKRKPRSKEFP